MTTPAAKWKADERQRRADAGYVRFEAWVPSKLVAKVRDAIAKVLKGA